jgi:hypothetical protein
VIDRWCKERGPLRACLVDSGPGEGNATLSCISGKTYPLTVEYKHVQNEATVRLSYGSQSIAKQAVPSSRLYHSPTNVHASPFSVIVKPAQINAMQSLMNGTTLSVSTAGLLSVFIIRARDKFSNPKTLWDSSFSAFVSRGDQNKKVHAAISANVEPGTFRVSYTTTQAGASSLIVIWAATGGIAATYYTSSNSTGFEQAAQLSKTEPIMDISWNGTAKSYFPDRQGTVRWRGLIRPTVATPYTFTTLQDSSNSTNPDDRVQLWLDGQLLLDQWTSLDQSPVSVSVSFPVAYEFYEVEMLYQSKTFNRLRLPVSRGSVQVAIPSSNLFLGQLVADSPYPIQVHPALTDLTSSDLQGSFLTLSTAGVLAKFSILCRDRFGNRRYEAGDEFLLHGVSSASTQILDSSSVHVGDGVYTISYVATLQDSYQIQVCTVKLFKCQIPNILIKCLCAGGSWKLAKKFSTVGICSRSMCQYSTDFWSSSVCCNCWFFSDIHHSGNQECCFGVRLCAIFLLCVIFLFFRPKMLLVTFSHKLVRSFESKFQIQ